MHKRKVRVCLQSGVTAAFFVSESGCRCRAKGSASQMSVMEERAQTCDALPNSPQLVISRLGIMARVSITGFTRPSLIPRLFHGQLPHPISCHAVSLSPSILYVPNKKILITTDSMSEVGQSVRRSGICCSLSSASGLAVH